MDRACDGCDDDVVDDGDDFIARDDQYGTSFLVGGLHQPEFGLGYHGSVSVIAIALAMASSSFSGVCGSSR